jgi:hypothetical protein
MVPAGSESRRKIQLVDAAHESKPDAQCFPEQQGVLEAVSFGPQYP